jgi:hypothetical protein
MDKYLHQSISSIILAIPSHLAGLLQTLLGCLPVHDIPDGLEIFCLAVLVVEAMRR